MFQVVRMTLVKMEAAVYLKITKMAVKTEDARGRMIRMEETVLCVNAQPG